MAILFGCDNNIENLGYTIPVDIYNELLDSTTGKPFIKYITNKYIDGDIILDMESYSNIIFCNCRFLNFEIRNSSVYDIKFMNCTFDNITLDNVYILRGTFMNCTIINDTILRHTKLKVLHINDTYTGHIKGSVYLDTSIIITCEFLDFMLNDSVINRSEIIDTRNNRFFEIRDTISAFLNCRFINTSFYNCKFEFSYFYKCVANKIDIHNISLADSRAYDSNIKLPSLCPIEGSFIGYKRVLIVNNDNPFNSCIAVLEIPEDALRISVGTNKFRCSKARVLRFENCNGGENLGDITCCSMFNRQFKYKLGEMIYPDSFDDNMFNQCASGIHFFMNKEDAKIFYM